VGMLVCINVMAWHAPQILTTISEDKIAIPTTAKYAELQSIMVVTSVLQNLLTPIALQRLLVCVRWEESHPG
jgi:hypothetical protein